MLKTITINTETHKVVPLYPTAEMVAKAQFHTEHSALDEDDKNHYRAKGQALAVYSEMIEAAPEFNASPWQPIETAPKDGSVILGALPDSNIPQSIRFKKCSWVISWDHSKLSQFDEPTHWMPPPPAPEGI